MKSRRLFLNGFCGLLASLPLSADALQCSALADLVLEECTNECRIASVPKLPIKKASCGKTCFEDNEVTPHSDCARWDQTTDRIETLSGAAIGFVDRHVAKGLDGKPLTKAEVGCLFGSLNNRVYELAPHSECARWDQSTNEVYALNEVLIGIVYNGSGRDFEGKSLAKAGVTCLLGSLDRKIYDPLNLPKAAVLGAQTRRD